MVLADEVNRAPPRTQSALLEVMAERQATIDGKTFPLGDRFLVIATQNSQEFEGTFPLPEAQIDRFMIKVPISRASVSTMKEILLRNGQTNTEVQGVNIDLGQIEDEIGRVSIDDSLVDYIARLVDALNTHEFVDLGPSVRGAISLLEGAKVLSLIQNRDFIVVDDIKR